MGNESSVGGSTITQHLAKNIFPRRDRVSTNIIVNKIKEMIIAKRLERVYDKQEILTHYLNTVSKTQALDKAPMQPFQCRYCSYKK